MLAGLEDGSVDCVITSPPYWGLRDYGTGLWDGGDPDCDHSPEQRGGRFATPVSAKQASNTGSGTISDRDCRCGARRVDRQLGLEPIPDLYVANMVAVFRELRRVLAGHGTCWVNLGDSYAGANNGYNPDAPSNQRRENRDHATYEGSFKASTRLGESLSRQRNTVVGGLKPKDLVGIPWRVAFALQADGWYLRSDIVWSKPNPMPESVTDRPTKAHEYVFLLTKSPRYWFDQEAVREPAEWRRWGDQNYSPEAEAMYGKRIKPRPKADLTPRNDGERWNEHNGRGFTPNATGRNVRSVWEIATQPYPEAHFATYPEELVRRCLLAGCPEWVCRVCGKPRERIVKQTSASADAERAWQGVPLHQANRAQAQEPKKLGAVGTPTVETLGWSDCGHNQYRPGRVLDPFIGSGTTALVARRHGRHTVGAELNPAYAELAAQRLQQLSLLAEATA